MTFQPLLVSLPVADRLRAHAFYRDGLGLEAVAGEPEDEVDQIVRRARAAGAKMATEPAPQPWGSAAGFSDPDGHIWLVSVAHAATDDGGQGR